MKKRGECRTAVLFCTATNRAEWVNQAVKDYRSTSRGSMLKVQDASKETLVEAGTYRLLSNRPLFVLTAMARFSNQTIANWKLTAEQAKKLQENRHPDAG